PSSSFPRRRESSLETGLLICSRGYETHELPADAPFERHTGAHPVPDQSSLDAGTALLQFIAALPAPARLAILVSGGTSASVEVPAPGITLDFLRRANRWLLASGLPIDGINHVRAGLSSIKGGGLAQRLKNMRTKVWVLSDIPGKDLNAVGGGLFAAPKDVPWPTVPDWLAQAMRSVPATTEFDLPLERLGGNEEAVAAVAEQGARVWGSLRGEAAGLGAQIGQKLIAAPPGRYVLGGEVTVRLPGDPGRGGRCQQLALAAAVEIAGQEDCFLLAASTDGWDGTDPVAGACVDGGTISRGGKEGFDVRQALRQADAGRFLEASGDLIRTGPTGTHVNDLVIACKRKANSERAS
ncbi:MAG: DUF4147 domain-containing protein, partial [Gammaproteobacteria bacterium]|nr:DUF4147 domain-containing protein [Gammaproteobacteria bacterium]